MVGDTKGDSKKTKICGVVKPLGKEFICETGPRSIDGSTLSLCSLGAEESMVVEQPQVNSYMVFVAACPISSRVHGNDGT